MKLKHIILGTFAAAALLVGCTEKEGEVGTPSISINPTELSFTEAIGQQTIELNSTREWEIVNNEDWVTVTPDHGQANKAQKITISVLKNEKSNRTANITFTIGLKKAFLKVSQAGPNGDQVEVTSIADFIAATDHETKEYTICGTVESVANTDSYKGVDFYDATGYISAAFPTNFAEYLSQIKPGVKITMKGIYGYYEKKQLHQIGKKGSNATIISVEEAEAFPIPLKGTSTIKDFLTTANSSVFYTLSGTVSKWNPDYKSFILTDAEGTSVEVYQPMNVADFANFGNGCTVTLNGRYEYFTHRSDHSKDKPEVKSARLTKVEGEGQGGGEVNPEPEVPGEIKTVSVKDFLAASEGTQLYQLTGKIFISNSTYGNLYIEDNTGCVYIYGLTATPQKSNDQSFATLNLKNGDELTMVCSRGEFSGNAQGLNGYYISHKAGVAQPEKQDGKATWALTSSISFTKTDNAQIEKATINGTPEISILKLGQSKIYGKSTLTIPAGTKKLGFYALAWKNELTRLKFGNGTIVNVVRNNVGCSGKSPYTIKDVTAIDYYEIDLNGNEGTLTVETIAMGKRVILFGFNPVTK